MGSRLLGLKETDALLVSPGKAYRQLTDHPMGGLSLLRQGENL